MAAPGIGIRPFVVPAKACPVDPSHPLAAGLVKLFTPHSIPELVVNSGSANYTLDVGPMGLTATRGSDSAGYQYLTTNGAAVNTSQSMFAWFTTPTNDGTGYPTLLLCNNVALNLETFTGTTFGATKRGKVDVPTSTITKTTPGTLTFCAVSFSGATNQFTFYYGGLGSALQCETPANATTLAATTTNGNFYIGSQESSQGCATGTKIFVAGLYNRALSANEMGALFADPFQMLRR